MNLNLKFLFSKYIHQSIFKSTKCFVSIDSRRFHCSVVYVQMYICPGTRSAAFLLSRCVPIRNRCPCRNCTPERDAGGVTCEIAKSHNFDKRNLLSVFNKNQHLTYLTSASTKLLAVRTTCRWVRHENLHNIHTLRKLWAHVTLETYLSHSSTLTCEDHRLSRAREWPVHDPAHQVNGSYQRPAFGLRAQRSQNTYTSDEQTFAAWNYQPEGHICWTR